MPAPRRRSKIIWASPPAFRVTSWRAARRFRRRSSARGWCRRCARRSSTAPAWLIACNSPKDASPGAARWTSREERHQRACRSRGSQSMKAVGSTMARRSVGHRLDVLAGGDASRRRSPVRAAAIDRDGEAYCLQRADGRKLRSRAVVVASGAKYQSVPIAGIEAYESRGIYYGATPMEAQLCGNAEVTIVGAGNSAGQGAIYLARVAKKVHVILRRSSLRETMRSEEHTSELQSLMRISYAVLCLRKKKNACTTQRH